MKPPRGRATTAPISPAASRVGHRCAMVVAAGALLVSPGLLVGPFAQASSSAPGGSPAPTVPTLSPPVALPEGPSSTPECTITGTESADVLRGTPGDDVICGLGGADVIVGGGGEDTLIGGAGRDTLRGGGGDDAMTGGPGRDSGSGGRGADICSPEPGLADCTVDVSAPLVSDISVPAQVEAGTDLILSWTATDATAVTSWAYVGGRNGWEMWCFGDIASPDPDVPDGSRFTMTCSVPADIPNGEYVVFIVAADLFGSSAISEHTTVIGGGSDDVSAPSLITPPVLAPIQPGDSVSLRWELADSSGVAYTELWIHTPEFSLVGYDQKPGSTTTPATIVSGDERSGIWEQQFTISPEASRGSYLVTLSVRDVWGNRDVLLIGHIDVGGGSTPVAPDEPSPR